jgi:hypothetical protein
LNLYLQSEEEENEKEVLLELTKDDLDHLLKNFSRIEEVSENLNSNKIIQKYISIGQK